MNVIILGFLAGAFIALGFLLDIRVIAGVSADWGGIAGLIGAAVFPIGLILVLLAGGELLTGNMMAVSLARFKQRISTIEMIRNLALVTVSNLAGALLRGLLFGHVTGLTASGIYLEKLVAMAGHKLDDSFLQAFLSGHRLQLACSTCRVAVLRVRSDERQNYGHLVSDDGFCSDWFSARSSEHVPHSGGHF